MIVTTDLTGLNVTIPKKQYGDGMNGLRSVFMNETLQPEINRSEIPNNSDTISRQQAIDALKEKVFRNLTDEFYGAMQVLDELPSAQPERKTGHWILDRSGAYCCSKCMEPCAGYVMMKPRDRYCKMCGSRNEVME